VQDPTPIEISGLCRCLVNLEENETYILYFLPPFHPHPSCLKNVAAPLILHPNFIEECEFPDAK